MRGGASGGTNAEWRHGSSGERRGAELGVELRGGGGAGRGECGIDHGGVV
jgi:hypothetical protein